MTLVVDASVATKWFVAKPDSPDARALLISGEALIAPDLVVAEACNVAWKKRRAGQITPAQAAELAAEVGRFLDALIAQASQANRPGDAAP